MFVFERMLVVCGMKMYNSMEDNGFGSNKLLYKYTILNIALYTGWNMRNCTYSYGGYIGF